MESADTTAGADAGAAYAALAPAYDLLTEDYEYDRWLDELERLARRYGLRGRRVLDVACGTGKSFRPLLERGYDVTGCDLSAEMLVQAARRAMGARLLQADMRHLGPIGRFDLVTCLDDALNYLLTEEELHAAFGGFASNLATDGVVVFDVNTLRTLRTAFATSWVAERGGFFIAWEGRTPHDLPPGGIAAASVHLFRGDGDRWARSVSVHRQRHWGPKEITAAAEAAGLRTLAVCGQSTGARIEPCLDELVHTKAVFIAKAGRR